MSFAAQRRARVREFLGIEATDAEADKLFGGYLEIYEGAWRTFDDAIPTLRRVRAAGLSVAVLTNGDDEHQRLKLGRTGLTDEIDVMVASMTLPAGKPHAGAFITTCERAGVAPAEALMVGNSLAQDVRGALAAGLDAILLDRHDEHPDTDVSRISTLHDLSC